MFEFMEFVIVVLAIMVVFGWAAAAPAKAPEVADRWAACPECPAAIQPGARIARNAGGQPCHLRCQ